MMWGESGQMHTMEQREYAQTHTLKLGPEVQVMHRGVQVMHRRIECHQEKKIHSGVVSCAKLSPTYFFASFCSAIAASTSFSTAVYLNLFTVTSFELWK
jgi:hypothetical protein